MQLSGGRRLWHQNLRNKQKSKNKNENKDFLRQFIWSNFRGHSSIDYSWENARASFAFFEDDIVEVLIKTLGMSEIAARNWFDGTEAADISIEQLVRKVKEHIDSKGKVSFAG